jgi:hypothetical protein
MLTRLLITLLLTFCYLIYLDGQKNLVTYLFLTFLLTMFCYFFRCKASIKRKLENLKK